MLPKTIAAVLVGATVLTAAPADADVRDSREVESFSEIKLRGSMDAVIRVGEAQSVTVIGDEEDVEWVTTEVKDGRLVIRQKDGRGHRGHINIEISVPTLNAYKISGSGDAEITGIDSEAFDIGISGSGDVEASGRCGELNLGVSGSGDVDAENLRCRDVAVRISGSGDAAVYASESVSISISGSGDVDLYGNPRLEDLSINGSGDISTHSSD